MRGRIDWNDIEVFLAVAEAGSLSSAARKFRVQQTTLGRNLARLEAEAGMPLFDRSLKGYMLTPFGTQLVDAASKLVGAQKSFLHTLQALKEEANPIVRIHAGQWMSLLLVSMLPEVTRAVPQARILLETGETPEPRDLHVNDIVVDLDMPPSDGYARIPLCAVPYGAYGAEAYVARHPAAFDETRYSACRWVIINQLSAYGAPEAIAREWGYPSLPQEAIAFRCTSVHALIDLVKGGHGLAFLPIVVGEAISGLERVSDPLASLEHKYSLYHSSQADRSRIVMRIVRVLTRLLVERLSRGG